MTYKVCHMHGRYLLLILNSALKQQFSLYEYQLYFLACQSVSFYWGKVANVKNWHLQNDLLIAVICWTNSHQSIALVAVNSIASLGWKINRDARKIWAVTPENNNLLSQYWTSIFVCECTIIKKHWWFDLFSMIAIAVAGFQKWVFIRQEQKNDFQKFLTPQ